MTMEEQQQERLVSSLSLLRPLPFSLGTHFHLLLFSSFPPGNLHAHDLGNFGHLH